MRVSASLFVLLACVCAAAYARDFRVQTGYMPSNTAWGFMKFYPETLQVQVNDTITFFSNDIDVHAAVIVPQSLIVNTPYVLPLLANPPPANSPPFHPGPWAMGLGDNTFNGSSTTASKRISSSTNPSVPTDYSQWTVTITQGAAGDYKVWCPYHWPVMVATITVLNNTVSSYNTPADVKALIATQQAADLTLVSTLNAKYQTAAAVQSSTVNGVTTHTVYVGAADGQYKAVYNAFFPSSISVKPNDVVVFNSSYNQYYAHTVTFGKSGGVFEYRDSAGMITYNTSAVYPTLTNPINNYAGGFAHSGLVFGNPDPTQVTAVSVRFTASGTYPYVCWIHEFMGMNGVVSVAKTATASAAVSVSAPAVVFFALFAALLALVM